ncbi:2-hydroxy-3-oxopropionate reductase [Cohnella sp.]|uniref:2-hydroxy-3-oxopropionate reductase n=1 Tax=Cohnella sp. TaxID=1883426 RepID=UPI00356A9D1F
MNVGFIGIGIMGKPMSRNLLKEGFALTVADVNEAAVRELVQEGAKSASSPMEVARESDVIITMLPNNAIVRNVILGDNGIVHGAKPGAIVVDMSSVSPIVSKEVAAALREHGLHLLDAPVSGGEPKAIDGTLAIMVGGEEEIYKKAEPVLAAMGKDITLVGGNGCGSIAKLANQIIVNVNIAAMSEAFVLAAKSGIDVEKMYQAIRGGLAGSTVLDAKAPMVLERNFQPGGRIDINMKDLTNVMEAAEKENVPLPLTSHVLEVFQALEREGKQGLDHSGIIQYYESLTGVKVEKRK